MRLVRVITAAMEKQRVLHILIEPLPLVIQHAKGMRRIILSPVARMTTTFFQPISLYHNFLHYLVNGTILGNKLLNIKRVFRFSVQFSSETSHSTKNSARQYHNLHRSSRKYPLILSDYNKT